MLVRGTTAWPLADGQCSVEYVYIRTALELNRRYGLRKFIVVVPSVAVREGVIKSLKITQDHLRALYDNVPYRYTVYDSKSIAKVRQFAQSDCVELLVMTIDSFNKEDNVMVRNTFAQGLSHIGVNLENGRNIDQIRDRFEKIFDDRRTHSRTLSKQPCDMQILQAAISTVPVSPRSTSL
jgi:restriction endonuclease